MSLSIYLRKDAEQDLLEAADWYENQQNGLGHRFLDEVLAVFATVAESPLQYPLVHRKTRRALLQRFPFGVYYRIEEDIIVVIAVIHGSRDPQRWKER